VTHLLVVNALFFFGWLIVILLCGLESLKVGALLFVECGYCYLVVLNVIVVFWFFNVLCLRESPLVASWLGDL
jgi:hypothetical protein